MKTSRPHQPQPTKARWLSSKLLWVVVLVLMGLGGAYGYSVRNRSDSEIVTARRGPIVEAVYGLGTVTASRTYQLRVGVVSTMQAVLKQEGDWVREGTPLVRLESGVLSRAPFDGTVTAIGYKEGETVFPQTPVLNLVDLKHLYVAVSLEQQGALRVKRGQPAILSFESLRSRRVNGTVRSIFPVEGQFIVRIDVEDLPAEVLPGMTADVAIQVARRESALLVPVAAISAGKLIVVRNGRQEKIDVKIGTVDGSSAEILSDNLKDGDAVLSRAR